jgi:hypothetical protein
MGGNSARQWLFSANFPKRRNPAKGRAPSLPRHKRRRRADPAAFGFAREGELAKRTLHLKGGTPADQDRQENPAFKAL